MCSESANEITRLLRAWRSGDRSAIDQLMPHVYDQLRSIAIRYLRRERADHTLRATALVNEAYLRLASSDFVGEDRIHFFSIAAITMRRILVDYARSSRRVKRGSGGEKISWDDALLEVQPEAVDILDLDAALSRLATQDVRKANLIELVYFGGMTGEEAAQSLGVSLPTANRDLKLAKAWLRHELGPRGSQAPKH